VAEPRFVKGEVDRSKRRPWAYNGKLGVKLPSGPVAQPLVVGQVSKP